MWRNSNGDRQANSVSTEIVKIESIHISISAAPLQQLNQREEIRE
jgi:hypothetical protein